LTVSAKTVLGTEIYSALYYFRKRDCPRVG